MQSFGVNQADSNVISADVWHGIPNEAFSTEIENYTEVSVHFKFGDLGKAIEWCKAESGREFRVSTDSKYALRYSAEEGWESPYNFYFKDGKDAIAFKLKWG